MSFDSSEHYIKLFAIYLSQIKLKKRELHFINIFTLLNLVHSKRFFTFHLLYQENNNENENCMAFNLLIVIASSEAHSTSSSSVNGLH